MPGICPATHAYRVLGNGPALLVGAVTAYLGEMMDFIGELYDPFFYKERLALNFRQAFIKVYQRHFVVTSTKSLSSDGNVISTKKTNPMPIHVFQVPISSYNNILQCKSARRTLYTAASPDEIALHAFWKYIKVTTPGTESKSKYLSCSSHSTNLSLEKLGVGAFSWCSAAGLRVLAFDDYAMVIFNLSKSPFAYIGSLAGESPSQHHWHCYSANSGSKNPLHLKHCRFGCDYKVCQADPFSSIHCTNSDQTSFKQYE